jgi:hypothetical protein
VKNKKLLLVLVGLTCSAPAYAYLDPYIGSWLYQLLFPLLVAIAGAWAVLRHKVSHFISSLAKKLRGK